MYANIAHAIKDIAFHRYEISERKKNVDLTVQFLSMFPRYNYDVRDLSFVRSKRIIKEHPKNTKSRKAT